MKSITGKFFLFLLLFTNGSLFGQKYVISFPADNSVYKNGDNFFSVAVAGVACERITIKTENGTLLKVSPCEYIYHPLKEGNTSIDVYISVGKKLKKIGSRLINIKDRPTPEAFVGGFKGGKIKKGALKAQQGIGGSWFIAGNHWENCDVVSFNVIVLRNNKIFFEHFNRGYTFNNEVKNIFKDLLKDDKVLFVNITGCIDRENGGPLKGLEFTIEDEN